MSSNQGDSDSSSSREVLQPGAPSLPASYGESPGINRDDAVGGSGLAVDFQASLEASVGSDTLTFFSGTDSRPSRTDSYVEGKHQVGASRL